jgi:3-isopropylmalate dehydrogenase
MNVLVLRGDGVGPEVVAQALKVLKALMRDGLPIELAEAAIGAAAYETTGASLPEETMALARRADAILFGATGRPDLDALPQGQRPGDALLRLRKELALFANFRPVRLYDELIGASTLKAEVVQGLDMIILRELNGDIYYGTPRGPDPAAGNERAAINTMRYTESEIERIAHVAFRAARKRRRRVCSVDKANVLETMRLWRTVVAEIGQRYPDVELTHLHVDAAAMNLIRAPRQFDVLVTGNMFGDILSDAAAMLTGSIGMLPSAALGYDRQGLYEPVHGSAPDIAGKDVANPLAAILSTAMMLRMSFDQEEAARRIENAVGAVLRDGYRTADIDQPGARRVGTEAMGDAVVAAL